jgi:hypothetical protein
MWGHQTVRWDLIVVKRLPVTGAFAADRGGASMKQSASCILQVTQRIAA